MVAVVGYPESFKGKPQPQVGWRYHPPHGSCEGGEPVHGEAAAEEECRHRCL